MNKDYIYDELDNIDYDNNENHDIENDYDDIHEEELTYEEYEDEFLEFDLANDSDPNDDISSDEVNDIEEKVIYAATHIKEDYFQSLVYRAKNGIEVFDETLFKKFDRIVRTKRVIPYSVPHRDHEDIRQEGKIRFNRLLVSGLIDGTINSKERLESYIVNSTKYALFDYYYRYFKNIKTRQKKKDSETKFETYKTVEFMDNHITTDFLKVVYSVDKDKIRESLEYLIQLNTKPETILVFMAGNLITPPEFELLDEHSEELNLLGYNQKLTYKLANMTISPTSQEKNYALDIINKLEKENSILSFVFLPLNDFLIIYEIGQMKLSTWTPMLRKINAEDKEGIKHGTYTLAQCIVNSSKDKTNYEFTEDGQLILTTESISKLAISVTKSDSRVRSNTRKYKEKHFNDEEI